MQHLGMPCRNLGLLIYQTLADSINFRVCQLPLYSIYQAFTDEDNLVSSVHLQADAIIPENQIPALSKIIGLSTLGHFYG